jgi:hypothetical protein
MFTYAWTTMLEFNVDYTVKELCFKILNYPRQEDLYFYPDYM